MRKIKERLEREKKERGIERKLEREGKAKKEGKKERQKSKFSQSIVHSRQ